MLVVHYERQTYCHSCVTHLFAQFQVRPKEKNGLIGVTKNRVGR